MNCSYCFKVVNAGLYGIKLNCGHWVHSKCLNKKEPDFDNCAECKGEITLKEPLPNNKRDYINEPLADSWWLTFKKTAWKKEPFTFLNEQIPIRELILQKQYGLQKLLEAGVTIDDFLSNQYTWDDLKTFQDFQQNNNRSKEALIALKCNAEHFRDYYHVLGKAITDLNITGRDMVELYGIYFTEKTPDPMMVAGGKNIKLWSASDVLKLGMTMKDLYGARLQWYEQYANLEASEDEAKRLGVKDNEELTSFHAQTIVPDDTNKVIVEIHQHNVVKKKPVVTYIPPKTSIVCHGLKPKK
jgi:hypothetical protein